MAAKETTAEKATATERETKAPEYIGTAACKYQWDDQKVMQINSSMARPSTSTVGQMVRS